MRVTRGNLLLYYTFDVANEIHLERIERIFGKAPKESPLEAKRLGPQYVAYRQAPLHVRLGKAKVEGDRRTLHLQADAKIYDFGVVTVRFWLPLSGDLSSLAARGASVINQPSLVAGAKAELRRLLKEIAPALEKPHETDDWEDYAVFLVNGLEGRPTARQVLSKHGRDLARAVVSETEPVSEGELQEVLRHPLSYYEDDLALVDWNAAFVYDPRGGFDTLDVLEYAVIELLELRTYDDLLDRELDRAYDQLAHRRGLRLALAPFSRPLRRLAEVRLDVGDLIAKVENSLKLVGDVYLAKVYRAASDRFHLREWKVSLEGKLADINETYSLLNDEIQTARLLILEAAIVFLIVVSLFLPK
jgi:hypothetical protein